MERLDEKLFDMIFNRRSIRKYIYDKKVEADKIEDLLKAGMMAPSAHNQQPWHFMIIQDRGVLDKLSEVHKHGKMLKDAPLAIIVLGDPALDKTQKGFWIQDCSASIQNILLAATGMGLGSVWLGVYPNEERIKEVRTVINDIPENIIPLGIVSVGYANEVKDQPDRYKADRIHYERW